MLEKVSTLFTGTHNIFSSSQTVSVPQHALPEHTLAAGRLPDDVKSPHFLPVLVHVLLLLVYTHWVSQDSTYQNLTDRVNL